MKKHLLTEKEINGETVEVVESTELINLIEFSNEDGEPQETEGIKYQLPEEDEFPEEESDSRAEYVKGKQ